MSATASRRTGTDLLSDEESVALITALCRAEGRPVDDDELGDVERWARRVRLEHGLLELVLAGRLVMRADPNNPGDFVWWAVA